MRVIKINQYDNVAVALEDICSGESVLVSDEIIDIVDNVPAGNKIALDDILEGERVIKYGNSIGIAKCNIKSGEMVHCHNLTTGLTGNENCYFGLEAYYADKQDENTHCIEFSGYKRSNDDIGIRNELWIIPTVGCVNDIGRIIAEYANKKRPKNVDGVFCLEHPYGCSQIGEDQENTYKIIRSLCEHGNAGGILVLGLGCENLNLEFLKIQEKTEKNKIVRVLNCQAIEDEMKIGKDIVIKMMENMSKHEKTMLPVSSLKVGVKCGGSDALSGITANPLIGRVSEILDRHGASTLMTEVPEMFGAEHLLARHCCNRETLQKYEIMINKFKNYYINQGFPISENPSPGNKAGGISTLEEKALGCVQKCGKGIIKDVLCYGERIKKQGLNIVEGPGNDLVAVTALVAAGAHIILFSTGRGTPVGSIVPTIKISTNSNLFERKRHWVDFNSGVLIESESMENVAEKLLDLIQKVASGEIHTKNEDNGMRSFSIFKTGVTL